MAPTILPKGARALGALPVPSRARSNMCTSAKYTVLHCDTGISAQRVATPGLGHHIWDVWSAS